MAKVMFKGFEIRPSGKHFFKIYKDGVSVAWMRARSVEAAQAMINSTGRVMTRIVNQPRNRLKVNVG